MRAHAKWIIGVATSLTLLFGPSTASAERASDREARVRQAEDQLAEEPTLDDVRQAVLHHFRVTPNALERVRELTRSKAAVPYIIMSSSYNATRSERTLEDPAHPGIVDSRDSFRGNTTTSHLSFAWDFPNAIFTPTELQTYPLAEMQRNILGAINRMYFYRRQFLLIFIVDLPIDDRARATLRMRIEGYTALLNAYTGGWFGRQLPNGSF
jgi:hypothetical protein